jgi:RNA polymerase sigma-70 factor (ECF subfamily)
VQRLTMSDATDVPDELVVRAMTGEATAVGNVLAIIRPLVVRYCRARLGRMDRSAVSADDVAQEVCLAVLTALPGYRVQGRPFLAFVYGIASHKVIDAHRAATRNRAEPVADVPDSVEVADGPEQRALRIELTGEMAQLLDQLPDKQREILLLRVVVGLSAEETADAVGSTPGAVRVAQHRALARLRKSMPEEEVV